MTQRVDDLRRAAERPVRVIRVVAVGAVVVVMAGTAYVVVSRARRRAQEKTLRGKLEKLAQTVSSPKQAAEGLAGGAMEKLRAEIRHEIEREAKQGKPMRERLIESAARAAATAAVGVAMRSLQERGKSQTRAQKTAQ